MKKFLVVLLVGFTTVSFAQETKKIWTLRECVDYAIANNLDVRRSVYNRETGGVNALQSKMQMLPTLNANANGGYNWGRNIDPTTNAFVTERITFANGGLQSSLLLWNGFRQYYAVRQNETELNALSEDLIKAKNDVILSVINLYLNVIFNKELLANAQLQLGSTQQQVDRTRKLSEAGAVPRADVLNLEAQLATNELNLIQSENALTISLLQLKQALQLPASNPLDVEVPVVDVERDLILEQSAEEIFAEALLLMPEIRAAQIRIKSAEYAVRSARGNYYPRITLTGSISSIYSSARREFLSDGTFSQINSDPLNPLNQIGYVQGTNQPIFATRTSPGGGFSQVPFATQINDNLGKNLSLGVNIPLFNGFNARATVQRSIIVREQAHINALQFENTLRQSVETAVTDASAAYRTFLSAERQVSARDEAFRMTKQRFDAGAVNFVEYQVAENDLFQSKSDLLRAKYDLLFKKKLIDFYQGKPLQL